jgi:hypothetical protein
MVAAIHPLTPGSPVYAVLKVSAVGGLFALRVFMSRRAKRNEQVAAEPPPEEEAQPAPRPHPVNRRKRKRRRRRP